MGEKLSNKYPEVAEHLEALPTHVVDRLGESAVLLTHRDMHPKAEAGSAQAESETLARDFEVIITDPDYDASLLDEEAREAAEAGHAHVARLIHTTADALHAAHTSLEKGGFSFQANEGETDEERRDRERNEHEAVYARAADVLVESIERADSQGDAAQVEANIHALLLLEKTKPGIYMNKAPFWSLVRAGMSEKLLSACQSAEDLVLEEENMHLGASARELNTLLSHATGKKLDYSLHVVGDMPTELGHIGLWDDLVDICVASSANPNLSIEELVRSSSWSGLSKIAKLKDRYPDMSDLYTDEYIIDLMTEADNGQDLDTLIGCTMPVEIARKAKEIGIKSHLLLAMTGRRTQEDYLRPSEIDETLLDQVEELSKNHPDVFTFLRDNYYGRTERVAKGQDGAVSADLGSIVKVLGEFDDTMSSDIYLEILLGIPGQEVDELVAYCHRFQAVLDKRGLSHGEIADILEVNSTTMKRFFATCLEAGEEAAISDLVLQADLLEGYIDAYETIEYPLTSFKNAYEKPKATEVTEALSRLGALGLSSELAEEIFAAWSTYDAYTIAHYSNAEGFMPPESEPDQQRLQHMAREQSEAIIKQLKSIEAYAASYGTEALIETVDVFGIYNFARYDAAELYDQLARWKSGERIQTIVVNSRADWNSISKDGPRFEEGVGDGVFKFEANSGVDVARVAVQAGRYERAHKREPGVKRFILHAHGSGKGLAMGSRGESIDISDYQEAARNSRRIGSRDTNAYKRHLGDDFELILQSCSTTDGGERSIAKAMSRRHAVKTHGYYETTHGLIIRSDGSVDFMTDKGDGEPVSFSP